jgi:hypothetical protein
MDQDYVLDFTGTPPATMRFKLDTSEGDGSLIRIPFPESGAYAVWIDGVKMEETEWDRDIGGPAYLEKTHCGEWRYKGVDNDMDFYLTPGCELEVRKRDAILCNVRMEWTLDEFYADGGTTSFADRVSAVLGVHRSQVKVVSVYYGSVNVEYAIEPVVEEEYYDEVGTTAEEVAEIDVDTVLASLELTLTDLVLNNAIDFGAPVIAADIGGSNELIATDLTVAGFGASATNAQRNGFSATDALASFALMMVPTVMVLSRETEILELLGDLYNSSSIDENGSLEPDD